MRTRTISNDSRRTGCVNWLARVGGELEVVKEGWRTGPTATLLVFILEYFKLLLPWRIWRIAVHGILGWVLCPFRYLDLLLFRSPYAHRLGNHCYIWLRKRVITPACPAPSLPGGQDRE